MVYETAHQISFTRHSNNKWLMLSAIVVAGVISLTVCVAGVMPHVEKTTEPRIDPPHSRKVVIDTDPGVDDVMGLLTLLGDPISKVLAITCSRGNTDLPQTAINVLKLLSVANQSEVPVYAGTNYGLVQSPTLDYWFGKDGLHDMPFPDPPSPDRIQKEHAASYLARIVKEFPGEITIISIGPLTNLALALHLNPDFLSQAKRVVILGGSIRGQGNSSPGVEANFHMDPDAAAMVLDRALLSKTTITLVPMETVMENDLSLDWRWNTLGMIKNPAVEFINKLERKDQAVHQVTEYQPFDTYPVGIFSSPDFIVDSNKYYGFVENTGTKAVGALFVDYSNITQTAGNLEVVLEVNVAVLKDKMMESLSSFS